MLLFLTSFVLPVAAGVVLLILTNPMGFDWTQRVTGLLAITFSAYFLVHTVNRRTTESLSFREPEQSRPEHSMPVGKAGQPPPQIASSIQQTTSGAGSVAIIGDGNVVETNAIRDRGLLHLRPGSMQILVGQKADLFQAPSIKITNVGDVGVTITAAGFIVGEEERHGIGGLKVDGRLNHSWPYHLKPAQSVDAYLHPADLGYVAGKAIRELYVETGDGSRYRINEPGELVEFSRAIEAKDP